MKLDCPIGHQAVSPSSAGVLRPMTWFSPCQNPARRSSSRSRLPKLLVNPRPPCRQGWKSENPPTLPVLQSRARALVPAASKLLASSVPRLPHGYSILGSKLERELIIPETLHWRMQPPNHIANRLAQHRLRALPQRVRTRIGSRRNIHLHSFVLEQLANAKNVIRITHRHTTVHVIGSHDHGNTFGGLRRVRTLGFLDQVRVRDPAMHQVIVAHPAFAVTGIRRRPAGRNDHGSNALFKQVEGMIEAGPVYGRRATGILRRAEDYESVGGMDFLS